MSPELSEAVYSSPIGDIVVGATEDEVCSLEFVHGRRRPAAGSGAPSRALSACLEQLDEYFAGKRRIFELALRLSGTEFQTKVWRALLDVGFGETATYGDIARVIRRPNAVRAVGAANGRNPISIVIPCHRIVGSAGALVGYGGGLWRKEWLLGHEKKFSGKSLF
jgi:methylated-DNA-[protein]-cysteine S-methyltransferase